MMTWKASRARRDPGAVDRRPPATAPPAPAPPATAPPATAPPATGAGPVLAAVPAAVNAAAYGASNSRSGLRLSHARARATPSDVPPTPPNGSAITYPFASECPGQNTSAPIHLHRYNLYAMDGVRLHRLGKRLIDLSREVTTSAGDASLTPAEIAVIEDLLKNPGSPVSEIKARTGFAQRLVSESVARLKERGLAETSPDPADRRRTRVRLSEVARQAVLARAGRPADEVIAQAVPEPERVTALLTELADLLL